MRRLILLLMTLMLGQPWALLAEDTGVLSGTVFFPGETPPPAMIANADEANCPRGIAQNHLIVDQASLGLANVVVVIESPLRFEPRATPATLTFEHCRIVPRVQTVMLGTSLTIRNRDAAAHGLQVTHDGDYIIDAELPPGVSPIRRPMMQLGLHKVNCSHHLWERAWIYVSENPYAAITDAHGRFSIPSVPPGRYTVRAWHEGWIEKGHDSEGRLEFQPMLQVQNVTISAGKTKDIRFDDLKPTF